MTSYSITRGALCTQRIKKEPFLSGLAPFLTKWSEHHEMREKLAPSKTLAHLRVVDSEFDVYYDFAIKHDPIQSDDWVMDFGTMPESPQNHDHTLSGQLLNSLWGCILTPPPVTFSPPSPKWPRERASKQTRGVSCPLLWSTGSR